MILWSILLEKTHNIAKKVNQSNLSVELMNGSVIYLKSLDSPERLRGVSLDAIVIDECGSVRNLEEIFVKIIRPSLADKLGTADFISSPSGRNYFFKLWSNGKNKADWESFQYTTIQGMNVTEEEIEAAREDMDDKSFNQEFNGEFISFDGLVVPDFCQIKNNSNETVQDDDTLLIGVDFNINKNPASVWVLRNGLLHMVDAFYGSFDTEQMMLAIQNRYPKHKIIFTTDASGSARKTSAGGKTDVSIIESFGYTVKNLSKNPGIIDRVNSFNSMICNSKGERKLFFVQNKRTEKFIEALLEHYFDDNGMPNKKHLYHDDCVDSMQYLVWRFSSFGRVKPTRTGRR